MPLYESVCDTCRKRFEAFKRVSERRKDESCTCGGSGKRVLSGFAVGSGAKSTAASNPPPRACYTGG